MTVNAGSGSGNASLGHLSSHTINASDRAFYLLCVVSMLPWYYTTWEYST